MAFRKTVLRPREPQQAQAHAAPATPPSRGRRPPVFVDEIETAEDPTLRQALWRTERDRWRGMRNNTSLVGMVKIAIRDLEVVAVTNPLRLSHVTKPMLKAVVRKWMAGTGEIREGGRGARKGPVSAATIIKRLNCLSAIGIDVKGCRPTNKRKLKWWLRPDDMAEIRKAFGPCPFVDYLDWTIQVGPRVEENLRLTRAHFAAEFTTVTIPGTKTASAQRTLRLSTEARAIARKRFPEGCKGTHPMFPFSYAKLSVLWACAMEEVLNVDNSMATLKSVRRSAARTLSLKGMPLDMIRQYLGHSNIQTTMGYLALTGGYNEDEYARFLG